MSPCTLLYMTRYISRYKLFRIRHCNYLYKSLSIRYSNLCYIPWLFLLLWQSMAY